MAVTLSLFAGAGAQFFDNNGNVLSGGKIYTYAAGTTTPLAAYTTNSGAVFHTNPIILDAAGRVPSGGEIWLQLGIGYKFVLMTSADVLIATYDNIPSSAQPPAANDADSIMYEQGYTVTAGGFVVGKMYRIASVGTTNFTLIGASSNVVGTHFIATGAGTGTGTAELSQTVETKLRETVSVKDFGAVGNGVTDDTAAIQAAVTASVGKRLYFPAGTYNTTGNITLTSNIFIYGDGEASKIVVTGVGTNNIFNGSDVTSVAFDRLWLYGNNQANASGNGLAIFIYQTTNASAIGRNFYITNCRFDNFKGDYWVYFTNDSTTYEMQNFYVCNNTFNSYPGNARNGATPAVPSSCVSIQGSTAGANAVNINVLNNIANCQYIKTFNILWQGCRRAVISGNIVNNAGTDASISNDAGAYAFMAYDSSGGNAPRDLLYGGNTINGVKSCGFYGALALNIRFVNNKINNQTDTVTTTLPKGGIVFNSCTNLIVVGNMIETCAADGIYWQPDGSVARESGVLIEANKIKSCVVGVSLLSYLQNSGDVIVATNQITECTNGVQLQTIGSNVIEKLSIINNAISSSVASSYGIRLRSDDALYSCKNITIQGNTIKTVGYGIYWPFVTLGFVSISKNVLIGPFATRALEFRGCTSVSVIANEFYGQTSGGKCLFTVNANGSMKDNIFNGCATANILEITGSNDMGRNTPWWTPVGQGDFVQNVVAVESGTTPDKYVLTGWYYTGSAWVQQRMLTGN